MSVTAALTENPIMLKIPDYIRRHKACADWKRYHESNRTVMRAIVSELRRAQEAGRVKASVKAIINYLRWNMYIDSGEEYKINDKYTGIYTHVIAYNFPELAHMIDTRELRAVNAPQTQF
jgi:hypothetical protein